MPGRAIRSLSAAHSLLDELRAHAPWPPAAVMALGAHATAQYLHMALSSEQGAICYSLQVSAGGEGGAGAFVVPRAPPAVVQSGPNLNLSAAAARARHPLSLQRRWRTPLHARANRSGWDRNYDSWYGTAQACGQCRSVAWFRTSTRICSCVHQPLRIALAWTSLISRARGAASRITPRQRRAAGVAGGRHGLGQDVALAQPHAAAAVRAAGAAEHGRCGGLPPRQGAKQPRVERGCPQRHSAHARRRRDRGVAEHNMISTHKLL